MQPAPDKVIFSAFVWLNEKRFCRRLYKIYKPFQYFIIIPDGLVGLVHDFASQVPLICLYFYQLGPGFRISFMLAVLVGHKNAYHAAAIRSCV